QIYITGFKRKLDALAAAETDAAERTQIEQRNLAFLARAEQIMRQNVIPAHQRAASFLRSQRALADDSPSVSRLPNGEQFYAAALRIETTTELTPQQIHQIGRERVAALTTQLDIALRRVGLTEGTVGARLSQLTADPRHAYPATD